MNLDYLSSIVTNDLKEVSKKNNLTLMIGISPSKGARSPMLWNSCGNKESEMICLDIPNERNLELLYQFIIKEPSIKGGAVTAPYKSKWFELCENSTEFAKYVASCNSFYRSDSGGFICDNTDGKGFLKSLKNLNYNYDIKRYIVLGAGGVGKAIASSLALEHGKNSEIIWLSRDKSKFKKFNGVKNFSYDEYSLKDNNIETSIINCTSLGDYTNPENSIIDSEKKAREIIDNYKIRSLFDCIHTPLETNLIKYVKNKCDTSNGIDMNLFQAVYGYNNVHNDTFENTLSYMKKDGE